MPGAQSDAPQPRRNRPAVVSKTDHRAHSSEPKRPEAEAMRDYLLARGLPAGQIVMEDMSTSTAENSARAKALLDQRLAPGNAQVRLLTGPRPRGDDPTPAPCRLRSNGRPGGSSLPCQTRTAS
ncbi:MAG: YdcF family protein [Bifidobacteriaceae bacterium]|nr:YdcF family protein [Bifidobacteriaceae bacterium]